MIIEISNVIIFILLQPSKKRKSFTIVTTMIEKTYNRSNELAGDQNASLSKVGSASFLQYFHPV